MARKRVVSQFGMGTSLRQRNYTQAAARAIRDALWHNALTVADALGFPRAQMLIDVEIGVQQPEAVEVADLVEIFPYGRPSIVVVKGGLDVPSPDGSGLTVIANVAIHVSFDMETVHG